MFRRKRSPEVVIRSYEYEVVVIDRHGKERGVAQSRDLEPAIQTAILEPLFDEERIVVRSLIDLAGSYRQAHDFFYARSATPEQVVLLEVPTCPGCRNDAGLEHYPGAVAHTCRERYHEAAVPRR